jgi:hypothetical protein
MELAATQIIETGISTDMAGGCAHIVSAGCVRQP